MKKIITIVLLINFSTYANNIDISFGCYDCKKNQISDYKEKEIQKYKDKKKTLENIVISGQFKFGYEK